MMQNISGQRLCFTARLFALKLEITNNTHYFTRFFNFIVDLSTTRCGIIKKKYGSNTLFKLITISQLVNKI